METRQARNTDPGTSHESAGMTNSAHLEYLYMNTLRVIGSSTSDEVAIRLNLPLNSISPRTRPLVEKGQIHDSGLRRKTTHGRNAIVWAINEGK